MNTILVYAIELNVTVSIPEWQKDIRIMLEVPGFFGEDGFRYIKGRQTEYIYKHMKKIRCTWCGDDPLYLAYHDNEWGVPVYDDQTLFEFLYLEDFSSGFELDYHS